MRPTEGPLLLVGSSMGGWIALGGGAGAPNSRVTGWVVGIAAAPDFTERLMVAGHVAGRARTLWPGGQLSVPAPYGDPMSSPYGLIEDGRVTFCWKGQSL